MIIPSDSDLIKALLINIATHPWIKNPTIKDPRDGSIIKVNKFKTYGGLEIQELGLTISCYIGALSTGKHIDVVPYNTSNDYTEALETKLIVQVSYADADFDFTQEEIYNEDINVTLLQGNRVHGSKIEVKDTESVFVYKREYKIVEKVNAVADIIAAGIFSVPAEDIIRDYITLLRYVIRDIQILNPYKIRYPRITGVKYDTSKIFEEESKNLVFHSGYLELTLKTFESRIDPSFYPVEDIFIQEANKTTINFN